MRTSTLRRLALAGLLSIGFATHSQAQGGFWGDSEHIPSLVIAPTSIEIDVPMPVSSGNLQLMLAQAGQGGLADLKQQAIQTYTQHLQSALTGALHEYLEDEEVPLVQESGVLELQNSLKLRVIKHLAGMKPKGDYDLELGNVALSGEFRYTLSKRSGTALREQLIKVDNLKITSKYLTRTYHDGRDGEDNTEEAIKEALSELAEKLVASMEENLEADQLREIAEL